MGKNSKLLLWIGYRVRVTINDCSNRMLVGSFLAFDKHMNIVLADTEEFRTVISKKPGEPDREQRRTLGVLIIRGENIVSLAPESNP
jgi:small nuclear ribonucleoprotein B and B'